MRRWLIRKERGMQQAMLLGDDESHPWVVFCSVGGIYEPQWCSRTHSAAIESIISWYKYFGKSS